MIGMNTIEYYDRQKESWTEQEVKQLREEYSDSQMTISEIGAIHRRTPGSISYKLQSMKLLSNNRQARGYDDYKESELYKSIVQKGKISDAEKKANKEKRLQLQKYKEDQYLINQTFIINEIQTIKTTIYELKQSVQEIKAMLEAVYEFE